MKALLKDESKEVYALKDISIAEPKPDEILCEVEEVRIMTAILHMI